MAIRALGFEVKKADVLKILRDYDREGSGKIKFQDFSEVSKSYQELNEQRFSLEMYFQIVHDLILGNVELVCYTVKQEIFTLKIMRVKKFSWFARSMKFNC